jgi:hypothetical protein
MTSFPRKLAVAVGLALTCAATGAHAQYSRAAQQVIVRGRTAAGGASWNMLRGWHETGRQGGVRYESWLDPLRYGMRVETREAAGLHVHGFNGGGDWQITPAGGVTGVDDRATVVPARTAAFFRVYGFFYPARFDARADYVGVRKAQGRVFEVVSVQPWGGRPRELWFDRRTHLLGRIVDRGGAKPVTVEVSDYRRVGPVRVAFRFVTDDGDPKDAEERQVETVDFAPVDRALFSLPRPSAGPTPVPPPPVPSPAPH